MQLPQQPLDRLFDPSRIRVAVRIALQSQCQHIINRQIDRVHIAAHGKSLDLCLNIDRVLNSLDVFILSCCPSIFFRGRCGIYNCAADNCTGAPAGSSALPCRRSFCSISRRLRDDCTGTLRTSLTASLLCHCSKRLHRQDLCVDVKTDLAAVGSPDRRKHTVRIHA